MDARSRSVGRTGGRAAEGGHAEEFVPGEIGLRLAAQGAVIPVLQQRPHLVAGFGPVLLVQVASVSEWAVSRDPGSSSGLSTSVLLNVTASGVEIGRFPGSPLAVADELADDRDDPVGRSSRPGMFPTEPPRASCTVANWSGSTIKMIPSACAR